MGANRLSFMTGLAIGFVAGTRAGRERYDQMVKAAKTAKESPAFQQAAGAIQAQVSSAGQKVADSAPRLAQSAMHSVGDHVPLLKNRNSDSAGNGEAGVSASGNGHSKAAGS
jgi:hypothetical protein